MTLASDEVEQLERRIAYLEGAVGAAYVIARRSYISAEHAALIRAEVDELYAQGIEPLRAQREALSAMLPADIEELGDGGGTSLDHATSTSGRLFSTTNRPLS